MKNLSIYVIAIFALEIYMLTQHAAEASLQAHNEMEWALFKTVHGRAFSDPTEEDKRKTIYLSNLKRVNNFNKKNDSFKMGVHNYSDLTFSEFVKARTGYKRNRTNDTMRMSLRVVEPETLARTKISTPYLDLRSYGVVTGVKDQGKCGSCWAFATTAGIEAQYARKYKSLVSFSEQQLVSCDYFDYGCSGGDYLNTYKYVYYAGGIETSAMYPYTYNTYKIGSAPSCTFSKKLVAARINGVYTVPGDETSIMKALNSYGPLSVALCVDIAFQYYKSGVFYRNKATCNSVNHAVTLVGYGTDSKTGYNYWLLKNQWGMSWGENGYMRIKRGGYQQLYDPAFPSLA